MTTRESFIASIGAIAADQALIVEGEQNLLVMKRGLTRQFEALVAQQDLILREEELFSTRKRELTLLLEQAIRGLTGNILDGAEVERTVVGLAPYAPKVDRTSESKGEITQAIVERRHYMTGVVEACRSIMLRKGHPLRPKEMFALHPERGNVSSNQMGKALDIRTYNDDPEFIRAKGYYWVSDKPLPEGWDHGSGLDWSVTPETIRVGMESRRRRQRLLEEAAAERRAESDRISAGLPVKPHRYRRSSGLDPDFDQVGMMVGVNRLRAERGVQAVPRTEWPVTQLDAERFMAEARGLGSVED